MPGEIFPLYYFLWQMQQDRIYVEWERPGKGKVLIKSKHFSMTQAGAQGCY